MSYNTFPEKHLISLSFQRAFLHSQSFSKTKIRLISVVSHRFPEKTSSYLHIFIPWDSLRLSVRYASAPWRR